MRGSLGGGAPISIAEMEVDPVRMVKYMPAYYFPIVSLENFIEKMAELIRANRPEVNVTQELEDVRRQIPNLKYPIEDRRALLGLVLSGERKSFTFRGRPVDVERIMDRIPLSMFPFRSQADFEAKVAILMVSRPLIVKD